MFFEMIGWVSVNNDGLALVDTGLGARDYVAAPGILRTFKLVTIVPLIPEEAAIRQIIGLGYQPEDVRHTDGCSTWEMRLPLLTMPPSGW